MTHNKFKTNKLTAAASQDQSQTPQQEYVFSNLPVSGIQGQTEMKHTEFKTNELTTAAWNTAENHKTSKKGFFWGGSDGVDHVAREVLQHGVANRGSRDTASGNNRSEDCYVYTEECYTYTEDCYITPRTAMSTPRIAISTPRIAISTPRIAMSTPRIAISTPGIAISTPRIAMSTPRIAMSTPLSRIVLLP